MGIKQYRNTLDYKSDKPSQAFFDLCLYEPYWFQREIHDSKALYRVVSIGRQQGKSTLATHEAAYELCTKPNTVGYVVAPIYSQAQIIYRNVVALMKELEKKLHYIKITQNLKGIMRLVVSHYDPNTGEHIGDAIMEGKSAKDPDSLRGGTTNWIIVDEAAMVSYEALTEGLIPTGTTTKPWMLFISTPKGTNNWFYEYYLRGQDPDDKYKAYKSWQLSGPECRVQDSNFYLDKQRTNSDFVYRQEYLAEFISDSGSVFIGVDNVEKYEPIFQDASVIVGQHRKPGHSYYIGADFARYNDFTVYTVIDATTRTVVKRVRLNTVDIKFQLESLKQLSTEYNNCLVLADVTGMGIPIVEQLATMGVPCEGFNLSVKTKEELIAKLAIAIQNKFITMLYDTVTIGELKLYEYKRTDSGNLKMEAARGHDDCVISLALGWWHCSQYDSAIELNGDIDDDNENSGIDFRHVNDLLGAYF